MKKHKILIIHPSIYQHMLMAKGFREIGHIADTYFFYNPRDEFLFDHWEEFYYQKSNIFKTYINNTNEKKHSVRKILLKFLYCLLKYDTFIYMSPVSMIAESILPWGKEIALLKLLKKNILVTCSGAADIGTPLTGDPHYKLGDPMEKKKRCATIDKYSLKTMGYGPILYALQKNCNSETASRHNFWHFNIIDFDEWQVGTIPKQFAIEKKKEYTYIYHSFGNSDVRDDVKGTIEIKQAIESLKKKGMKIELIFFDKVPNKYLKYYQAQADIVIDQLKDGWHGQTAIECMALGKPIIVFYHPEIIKLHPAPADVPLIHATVDTIEKVLEDAVNNPEKMRKIGEKTQKYCKKYHDYKKSCKNILDYLYETSVSTESSTPRPM